MTHHWTSPAARALVLATGIHDPAEAMLARSARLIDEAGLSGPPAQLDLLASFQDIREIQRVPMHGAGRLIYNPQGSIIQVNSSDPPGRQNFTIAHEIAHTLLPTYTASPADIFDVHTGKFQPTREEEYLCDIGASGLLLDRRWLRPLALEMGPSLGTLMELADRFQASLSATAIALAGLNLWPCAIVFWEKGLRKSERAAGSSESIPPKLRVALAATSPSFGIFVPRNQSASPESSVYTCFVTQRPTESREWFYFGRVRVQLHAESSFVPYRKAGTLTPRVVSFLLR